MTRVRYDEMRWRRNPTPARGPDVLSLDELRHYLREFWRNEAYGITQVVGAKAAFLRACQMSFPGFWGTFLAEPPRNQFLNASTQRRLSRQVLNVLRGKIHYETDPKDESCAIGVYDPHGTPPVGAPAFQREIRFALNKTRWGPRLSRIAIS